MTCLCSCLRAEFQGCFGADLQPYFAAIQELGLLYRSLVSSFAFADLHHCQLQGAQCGHDHCERFYAWIRLSIVGAGELF